MRAFSIDVPAQRTSLKVLLGDNIERCTHIQFQAPEGNSSTVFFGDAKVQPFEVRPQANVTVVHHNIRDVHIRGTPPDKLSILLT